VALDYEAPLWGAKFVAHFDANYDSGYYGNYTDVAYDPATRAVTVKQPKGDKATIVNGRIALTEIQTASGRTSVSIWSRNLLNEEHVFYKSQAVTAGVNGFYNEPRTIGIEVNLKM
jgi:iron complex outermembrane receptor protein